MKQNLNIVYIVFVSLIVLINSSCGHTFDKIVCGEPEGRAKIFIDSVNSVWQNKLLLKQVPCYPGYIQIDLKIKVANNDLDNIENAFSRTVEWAELLVYDKDGKLIRGNTGSM